MKMTLDWEQYKAKAAKMVAEGVVLLRNDHEVLPLKKGQNVAVFGRIQFHYYKSGTGSGGMVNVLETITIPEGLRSCDIPVDEELEAVYRDWDEKNPFELGSGWGEEPWSQEEMPLEDEIVRSAASRTDTAIVIIGRTAGEEQDNSLQEGSYLLT